MGNECPECQTPIGDCKMRDVFKQQPKGREDLDLSHIKKGDYKKKTTIKEPSPPRDNKEGFNQSLSLGLNFGESVIIDAPKRVASRGAAPSPAPSPPPPKKEDLNISTVGQVRRPLTMQSSIQVIQLKRGVRYTGGAVQRQPHDRGKIVWQDGASLTGQFFLGNLAQSERIQVSFPDGSMYEGEVADGAASGQGKLTTTDGGFIEGNWRNDLPHGFCKQRMADGTIYEGNFIQGVRTGKGKLYFQQGMYEGAFEQDQFHGEGILVMNDGRTVRGVWRRGVLQGKGEMQWSTGEKYSGSFTRGVRDGQGTYWFNDGREWTGEWQEDRQNGFGSYQVKGEIIKSVWRAGVKKDEIRQIDPTRA